MHPTAMILIRMENCGESEYINSESNTLNFHFIHFILFSVGGILNTPAASVFVIFPASLNLFIVKISNPGDIKTLPIVMSASSRSMNQMRLG